MDFELEANCSELNECSKNEGKHNWYVFLCAVSGVQELMIHQTIPMRSDDA